MSARTIAVAFVALFAALPVAAQQRGTIEFGGFASNMSFDNSTGLNSTWGGGGRLGAFLLPRLSIEFEIGGGTANHSLGMPDAKVEAFAGRLTLVPLLMGPLSFLLGAGAIHTDYSVGVSDGWQGLAGVKLALGPSAALRADYLMDWNRNDTQNSAIHVGLSLYRNPAITTHTITRVDTIRTTAPAAPAPAQRPDSVSAAETARLRGLAESYRVLRDSLARTPAASSGLAGAARSTLLEMIYFRHDVATLSDSAIAILNNKVAVFQNNPNMRILITGFASEPGTLEYNMLLGMQRAQAAKTHLVSRGINAQRIEISTKGEGQLAMTGANEAANAANRRAEFHILIAEPPR